MRKSINCAKRTAILLASLAFMSAFNISAVGELSSAGVRYHAARHFERKVTKTVSSDYLLYLPKDYKPRGSRQWPLIVFLHGAGERGTNIADVAMHGPPKILQQNPDFPFIVVSPQCPPGETWSNDMVMGLLEEIVRKNKVDPKRIYLTGLSMGGFGSWSLAAAHPEVFAAVAPICGGGDFIGIYLSEGERRERLKRLPIWAFHGAKDNVVRLSESERLVDAFKNIGNNPRLTVYPEAGHDSWTATYDNPELYNWFLQHETDGEAIGNMIGKKR